MSSLLRLLAILIVLSPALFPSGVAAERPVTTPIRVEPSPQADKRLFLLRTLDLLYASWPTDLTDPREFAAAASGVRREARDLEQHALAAGLEKELSELFTDHIAALDAYADFLAGIGRIKAEAVRRQDAERAASAVDSGVTGLSAGSAALDSDMSGGDAAIVGLLAGLVNYAANEYQQGQAREAAEQAALSQAAREVTDRRERAESRAKAVAAKLSRQYGWGRHEVGFADSPQLNARVQRLIEAGDLAGLRRLADELTALRPRDPFLRNYRNITRVTEHATPPEEVMKLAEDSLVAATLVPGGTVYDRYRASILETAAALATEARGRQVAVGTERYGTTPIAERAVGLWEAALAQDPLDGTGSLRLGLGSACLASNRLKEARDHLETIGDLRNGDPDFAYTCACLNSREGRHDRALEWLKQSIKLGFHDISHIKSDPDLWGLRTHRAEAFNDLVEVKWEWQINFGFFTDDIVLTNRSAFPISGVELVARLEQNQTVWTPTLKVDWIGTGQSHTWKSAVTIPGSLVSKGEAKLVCDQNR